MQLHFKESGQGRAVILLHGLFGSSDNWHFIAQRLAEKFHVFAVDHRNHGLSPHSAEMNYPLMAGDVEQFFAARGLESASVVGHSMGGKTAMQFALQFPQRVEKLVIADMAPREYAPAHDKIFAALLALDLPQFQTRQQIEEALAGAIPSLVLRRFC
jgi:pimeloyl-ACP methyl ester carboxylesterase